MTNQGNSRRSSTASNQTPRRRNSIAVTDTSGSSSSATSNLKSALRKSSFTSQTSNSASRKPSFASGGSSRKASNVPLIRSVVTGQVASVISGPGDKAPQESGSEISFAPDIITSVREYCDSEPPNYLGLVSGEEPLYQPVNFDLGVDDSIIRNNKSSNDVSASNSNENSNGMSTCSSETNTVSTLCSSSKTSDSELLRNKVRLDSLTITKYHLNGYITCASLSMDQNCYVRVSSDNWVTFQETQACPLRKSKNVSEFQNRYQFDFLLPLPRQKPMRLTRKRNSVDSDMSDNSIASSSETLTESDSNQSKLRSRMTNLFNSWNRDKPSGNECEDFYVPPAEFSFCIVVRNGSNLDYDFNETRVGYVIGLKNE